MSLSMLQRRATLFRSPTASRPKNQTRAMDEQFFVHIRLHALTSLTTDRKIKSGETIGGLSLLFEDQTEQPTTAACVRCEGQRRRSLGGPVCQD